MLCSDPSPWLCVSDALKEKNKAKPYDPKKSVWVPNKAGRVSVAWWQKIWLRNSKGDLVKRDKSLIIN
jgi:hypothetical protein